MISREEKLEVLRGIAHPVRRQILEEFGKGVKCVSDLEGFSEIRQSSISQHLPLLRNHDLIDFYIDGKLRCYFLKEPFIPDLLGVARKEI
ncbi:MAG: metalloregulator ArsR/SmtB family transcription factor [Candidatus Sulfobium sp.]|jgi:ArsR family transcriptional regulator